MTDPFLPGDEELIDDLRSALTHLDDPLYLEDHALARRFGPIARSAEVSRGQSLRRTLRLAIEALDPGVDVPVTSPEARAYQVLHRHAIAKESMTAVARKLDISERQAYRELRRALEALAHILLHFDAGMSAAPADGTALGRAVKVKQELQRLETDRYQEVAINSLVADVVENARPLALGQKTDIELCDEAPGLIVATSRVMLRQAILNLLSHIVSARPRSAVTARLTRAGGSALLQFAYRAGDRGCGADPSSPYQVALQLLDSLGIRYAQDCTGDGDTVFSITVHPAQERRVLVVDDNSGIISLFRSFLRHQACRVYGAGTAAEALQVLGEVKPDVVILDVMMPDRDGWEILQMLRRSEAGAHTKVIVCSIINDPQLAAALGADGFLHKPVDRASLLRAIAQVLASGV
jgi:CheY-like chemotaxis protein